MYAKIGERYYEAASFPKGEYKVPMEELLIAFIDAGLDPGEIFLTSSSFLVKEER